MENSKDTKNFCYLHSQWHIPKHTLFALISVAPRYLSKQGLKTYTNPVTGTMDMLFLKE